MDFSNLNIYLYHYTSLESLIKIVKSGILKFGELPRLNDITESVKEFYIEGNPKLVEWNNLKLLRQRFNSIGQISLSQDGLYPGYALHAMWGHYANCGDGCCIVFNKSRIIEDAEIKGYKHRSVIYDNANDTISLPHGDIVDDYLSSQCETLFFHKRLEWEHEQEYRLINLNCDHSVLNGIQISKTIEAVIFHTNCMKRAFTCCAVQNCIKEMGKTPALEYHYSSMWGDEQKNMLIDSNGNNLLDKHFEISI